MRFLFYILVFFFAVPNALAVEMTGYFALEGRGFINSPSHENQNMSNGPNLVVEPEIYHVSADEKDIFTFRPFANVDSYDNRRTHGDIRQMDWLHVGDGWEVRSGISKVFWGVAETNHLVDIINQIDAIEDVDGEDRLGQPMVQLGLMKEWGTLRFFYLPYFRERSFSGYRGRLRGEKPVETELTTYESSSKRWHPDVAVRYNNTFGDWDVGLAHFSGTSREPIMQDAVNADGQNILIPYYSLIDQTSLDVQYTKEGWLWKLEAMTRSGHGRRFAAFTAGVEYSFYSVFETNADLGLLLEYQFDDRGEDAPSTPADDDVFFGTRIALNDINDTEFLGGVGFDNDTGEMGYFVESARRFGNNWKIELEARMNANTSPNDPSRGTSKDDHFKLRLARYF